MADDRSAALLLRVWVEEGADQFRARLMEVGPGPESDRTVALASSTEDVVEAVRRWLDDVIGSRTATD